MTLVKVRNTSTTSVKVSTCLILNALRIFQENILVINTSDSAQCEEESDIEAELLFQLIQIAFLDTKCNKTAGQKRPCRNKFISLYGGLLLCY